MTSVELYGLAPIITLAIVGSLALLLEVVGIPIGARRLGPRTHIAFVTVLGIAVAMAFAVASWRDACDVKDAAICVGKGLTMFGGQMMLDRFGIMITVMACVSALIATALTVHYMRARDMERGEILGLICFSAAGMSGLGMSTDLLTLFVNLEVLSVGVYALAGLDRDSGRSAEAALKYFINGAFAAAILLMGTALCYGATKSTSMAALGRMVLATGDPNHALAMVALGLVISGIAFKAATIPFHAWVPDVYDGAPAPVTAFMAAGVKAAAFAALVRQVVPLLPATGPADATFIQVATVVCVGTMTLGNLAALGQRRIKRMLAYSSIAHAGYVMVGIVTILAGRREAVAPIAYYLLAYAFMSLGSFGVVGFLERREGRGNTFEEWSGAARRYPAAGVAMAIFIFGLAGIPPTAGFIGKFTLFTEAVRAGLVPLVIIAVLNSLISVYYYLRVLVFMYMKEPDRDLEGAGGPWLTVGLATAAAAVLALGMIPSRYLDWAQSAMGLFAGR
ncbi:MAG: NADH-quinone oxidoreductase subunit N [Deltaproteobacteria bacterium]|nr:NADH-quinone oxidoreductase subunit N [Deltaproteobacteria bacterium]